MAWVKKNLAEGRRDVYGRKVPVQTGNLVYALFQHDTSRALDPQGHIRAVIGNMTQMPDGKWQALHADKIWSHNSIIGAIYHSYLRTALEKIRSEEHTSELQSLMRISYAVFCLNKKKNTTPHNTS